MRLVTDGTLGDRDRPTHRSRDRSGPCRLAILARMAAPVTQAADFGDVMTTLGMSDGIDDWAAKIARVETELLWARDRGLAVPAYVVRAFRDALERAAVRPASDFGPSSHVR